MTLNEVKEILACEVCTGDDLLDTQVEVACGADLMSDVLAFSKPQCLLLTGLANCHSVRTADMAEVRAIVYVRGKRPEPEAVELARAKKLPLLSTRLLMFEACGRLYQKGLTGGTGR